MARRSLSPLPLRRKVAYASVPCVTVLVVLEVVCRYFYLDPLFGVDKDFAFLTPYTTFRAPHFVELEQSLYAFDRERIYRLRPNASILAPNFYTKDSYWQITIDVDGFRVTPKSPPSGRTVLFMGDSITFGFWNSDAHTYPAIAQHLLNAVCPSEQLQVVNAGVPGYDSLQGRTYLEKLLPRLTPDIVVLAFGMNDQHLKGMSRADVLRRFRWTSGPVQVCSHLALFRTARRIIAGRLGSDDGDESRVRQVSSADFRAHLSSMIADCTSQGARVILGDTLIVVKSPLYTRALEDLAAQHDLPQVNFRSAVYAYLRREPKPQDLSAVMWEQFHPNGKGNQAIAIAVAQAVKRLVASPPTRGQGEVP